MGWGVGMEYGGREIYFGMMGRRGGWGGEGMGEDWGVLYISHFHVNYVDPKEKSVDLGHCNMLF